MQKLVRKGTVALLAVTLVILITVSGCSMSDPTLSSLAFSSGSLSPAFAPGTFDYVNSILLLPGFTATSTITALPNDPGATIQMLIGTGTWTDLTPGTASPSQTFSSGDTMVLVKVTTADGNVRVYTIKVHVSYIILPM